LANLKSPMVILRMSSPYAATVGGALAWLMLKEFFGKKVEQQLGQQLGQQVWQQVRQQVWQQVEQQLEQQVGQQVRQQVRQQVGQQVDQQLGQQVWQQVWQQVRQQVRQQLGQQVRQQLGQQLGQQVWRQVWQQVWQQVEQQLGQQVRQQVWQQVWQQVEQQLGQQVGQQVEQQVRQQVRQQVEQQVRQQVWQQVWQQVGQQVWQQVWQQVEQQLGQQVRQQLGQQVRQQVRQQLGQQVGQQVEQQVWQQVWQQVRQQVEQQKFRAANDGVNNYGINSLWCSWSAYISFFRDVCGWRDQVLEKFEINEELTQSCGWTWWHKNVLAISDRPLKISRDDQGRLHGEMGPSMLYRDGWALYNWHGVSVPSEWIEHKDKLTPKAALTWRNIEQRRAACEIVGWERILCELKGKSIDKDVDPQIGELIEVELPDGGPQRFLRVLCSTGRRFAIPVPREMKTALEANSATYGIPSTLFKPEVRT